MLFQCLDVGSKTKRILNSFPSMSFVELLSPCLSPGLQKHRCSRGRCQAPELQGAWLAPEAFSSSTLCHPGAHHKYSRQLKWNQIAKRSFKASRWWTPKLILIRIYYMACGPVYFHHLIVLSMQLSQPTKLKRKEFSQSDVRNIEWGLAKLSNRFAFIHNTSWINSAKTKADIQ